MSDGEYQVLWSFGEQDQLAPSCQGQLCPWILGSGETGEAATTRQLFDQVHATCWPAHSQ